MNNIKSYKLRFNNGWEADIPAGETVNVCIRAYEGAAPETLAIPVTQNILQEVGGTKDGTFYCINLRRLQNVLPPCFSFYIPN